MTDALVGRVQPPGLHVMTWNIRRSLPHLNPRSPDLWSRRKPLLGRLLHTEQPAVVGLQEGLPEQLHFVGESLGDRYAWIGSGRNADGGGEHCAIFHDTRRVRVDDWQQQWLSATPSVPGSRSWGNLIPRIVVIATLTDLATGGRLRVLNTHFDHVSRRSRLRSARMLRELAAASGLPAVVMGDMNTGIGSQPWRELTAGGTLRDCWTAADARLTEPWGTYSGYRSPRRGGRRIDWMLVTPTVEVPAVGIKAVRYNGAAASDHEPVQAVLRIPA